MKSYKTNSVSERDENVHLGIRTIRSTARWCICVCFYSAVHAVMANSEQLAWLAISCSPSTHLLDLEIRPPKRLRSKETSGVCLNASHILCTCLCVSLCSSTEHQNFLHLYYGGNLKMKLYLHHSNVNIVYRPKSDNQDRVILDHGALVTPLDPLLEGRLTVEGSELILKKVRVADSGVFKVTDLAGFPVAHVYIEVDGKREDKCK